MVGAWAISLLQHSWMPTNRGWRAGRRYWIAREPNDEGYSIERSSKMNKRKEGRKAGRQAGRPCMEGRVLAGRCLHSDNMCASPHVLTLLLSSTSALRVLCPDFEKLTPSENLDSGTVTRKRGEWKSKQNRSWRRTRVRGRGLHQEQRFYLHLWVVDTDETITYLRLQHGAKWMYAYIHFACMHSYMHVCMYAFVYLFILDTITDVLNFPQLCSPPLIPHPLEQNVFYPQG